VKKYQVIVVSCLLLSVLPYGFAQGSAESSVRGNLSGTVVGHFGRSGSRRQGHHHGSDRFKNRFHQFQWTILLPLLTPGFYGIKIEKSSFKTASVTGIEVVTGKTSNCGSAWWPAKYQKRLTFLLTQSPLTLPPPRLQPT